MTFKQPEDLDDDMVIVSMRFLTGAYNQRRDNGENETYSVDPDSFAHLAANVCEASLAVEAERLKAAVAEHASHLRIF